MTTNGNPNIDDLDLSAIDKSKLSPDQLAAYEVLEKEFRQAYLKNTQRNAGKHKQEMDTIRQQVTELEAERARVQQWWQEEGQYLTPRQQQQRMEELDLEPPQQVNREIEQLRREFGMARQQYDKVISDLTTQNKTLESALRLNSDLFNVRFKYPDADPGRILDTAKEKGITDMELAYKLAYDEDIRKKAIDDEVTKRVDEEKARLQAEKDIVDTKPATTKWAPPSTEGTASNYGEASQNLLASIRKSGGGGLMD